MDLGTIKKRLEKKDSTGYRYVQEFCEDVRLVFRNAMLYNDSSSDVYNMANTLSQRFEKKWKLNVEPRLLEEVNVACFPTHLKGTNENKSIHICECVPHLVSKESRRK
jgi:hypothetical protein